MKYLGSRSNPSSVVYDEEKNKIIIKKNHNNEIKHYNNKKKKRVWGRPRLVRECQRSKNAKYLAPQSRHIYLTFFSFGMSHISVLIRRRQTERFDSGDELYWPVSWIGR